MPRAFLTTALTGGVVLAAALLDVRAPAPASDAPAVVLGAVPVAVPTVPDSTDPSLLIPEIDEPHLKLIRILPQTPPTVRPIENPLPGEPEDIAGWDNCPACGMG